MNSVEIFFKDLSPKKQQECLDAAGYESPDDGNWDIIPLASVDFEPEEDEEDFEEGYDRFINEDNEEGEE